MIVIGVTGGVGTGKSTVSNLLGCLGAKVFDADRITHELMKPGTAVYRRILRVFGRDILDPMGRIDRKRLGAKAFQNSRRLKQLTGIVHPAVRRRIQSDLEGLRRRNPNAVAVLDIPLLVESGKAYRTDALVVVSAPAAAAARRLQKRSGWSGEEIRRRGRFQLPLRRKERQADFVVDNGGGVSSTRRQVSRIWEQIVKEKNVHGGRKNG